MKHFRVPKFLKSVKSCVAIVNTIFLLTGLLLLSAGIAVLVVYKEYSLFITQRFFNVPSFTLATGIIIICSSVLGFYGALSEQFYVLAGYVIVNLVVLVFELAVVIVSFGLRDSATSQIRSTMADTLSSYETKREVAIMWDNLQMGFECCGVVGRHDWYDRIPISCCHIDYGTVSPFQCQLGNAYTTGCAGALGDWLAYHAYVIAVIALFTLCLQVLLTGAAGWLTYRTKYEEVELES